MHINPEKGSALGRNQRSLSTLRNHLVVIPLTRMGLEWAWIDLRHFLHVVDRSDPCDRESRSPQPIRIARPALPAVTRTERARSPNI
jgi:hypothetical protein